MSEKEEMQKQLAEYKKIVEESFKAYIGYADMLAEWTGKNVEFAEELEKVFKYRLANVTSIEDLKSIAGMVIMLAKTQKITAFVLQKTLVDVKDIAYLLVAIPLDILERVMPAWEAVGKRFGVLEEELERLKKRKEETELKISENIERELKEWVQERERAKKAQSQYTH